MIVASLLPFLVSGCAMDTYSDRGAVLGGVTGALTGAAIGDNSNEALLGGAIGALAGGAVGSAIGDSVDRDLANRQVQYQQNQQYQVNEAINQVVTLHQQGLGEDVIINHVRGQGLTRPVTADEIIYLRNQGVPDSVITAMQTAVPSRTVVPAAAPAPSTVVIEEYHPAPPVYWHRRRFHAPYCAPRRGFAWGFSYRR